MRHITIWTAVVSAGLCHAADLTGDWIAEVNARGAEVQYARVKIQGDEKKLTGVWNQFTLEGSLAGSSLTLELKRNNAVVGTLMGVADGAAYAGEGRLAAETAVAGAEVEEDRSRT